MVLTSRHKKVELMPEKVPASTWSLGESVEAQSVVNAGGHLNNLENE